MKVKQLIQKLLDYNLDAEVSVVVHHTKEDFTITYGGDEGSTQNNCESVSFYVDRLCNNETLKHQREMKQADKKHLQWIHDRIVSVYGENENVDFLIKMREIISNL
jgi:hypothetical protein